MTKRRDTEITAAKGCARAMEGQEHIGGWFNDAARLQRARELPVLVIGPRQYRVGNHYVDLNGDDPCHCEDALLRWPPVPMCKHVMAALLHERTTTQPED